MGAGKGGDGGAEAAAEPVVLKMDLHCDGCAQKVKKIIKRVLGVESIMADALTNRVVVSGTADAVALKARLEAKARKAVEIVSAGSGAKKAAEPKDAGSGETKADKDAPPKEDKEKEKKQPPEEKKPKEETVLLKIRLHCAGCADRIRRRIYKFKGVKDVMLDGNANKDEVKVSGTMDIAGLLSYLKEKLNRDVEAVAPAKKDGGEAKEDKKDKGGDGEKNKAAAASAPGAGDDTKGKGIEVAPAGPPTAAAAAFMAAPAGPSTYHVAPPQGYVAYQQGPPPPASASYYPPPYAYPYYGNADGMGHANPGAATYYPHPYQHQQHDGSQQPQHQAYPPYPYRFDMAPAPQLFSDENPNACSVM